MNESRIIQSSLDLGSPPPLTPEQKEKIRSLAARPDAEIDYSDIPPLDLSRLKPCRVPAGRE